jgi:tetratricopeptide (TPR) repeat protein
MKRRVNYRFLACLLGVFACLAAGGHWLHAFQVQRNAGGLKERADQARAAQPPQYDAAVQSYRRYLALIPNDGDARANYGLALDQLAKSPRERQEAFFALDRALRDAPDRDDARRQLVSIAMDIERFPDAKYHLEALLVRTPANAELEHLLGCCLEAEGKFEDAAEQFSLVVGFEYRAPKGKSADAAKKVGEPPATGHDPARIESYVRLADLFRQRLNKAQDADKAMDFLVERNGAGPRDKAVQAHVARAHYYRTGGSGLDKDKDVLVQSLFAAETFACLAGNRPFQGVLTVQAAQNGGTDLLFKAEQDLVQARLADPDGAEVLLESAQVAQACNWLGQAEDYARRGREFHPKDLRMYKLAVDVTLHAGRQAEAIKVLREGVNELPNERDLTFLLADLLLATKEFKEADACIVRLKAMQVDLAFLDYLEGRRHFANDEWLEASKSLERSASGLARRPEMARRVALLLGKCYEQLGDPDEQYSAYRRALPQDPADPSGLAASEGIAQALLALNKVNEAIKAYERLIPQMPGARLVVVRLLLVRNLGLPDSAERTGNWQEIDQLLAESAQLFPKSMDVAVLHAQALAARSNGRNDARYQEAQNLLQTARETDPQSILPWLARAGVESALGKPRDALSILDEAERQLGDRLELRLSRIRILLQSEDKGVAESLVKVEEGIGKFTPEEQLQLGRGLAEAYITVGTPAALAKAREWWEWTVARKPKDLGLRLRLFDLAVVMDDDDRMGEALRDIHDLEGGKETMWRYGRAVRAINSARHGELKALDEARSLLASVASRRPNWSRVPAAQARIELLRGKPDSADSAIRYYLSAVEMGERSPAVILDVVRLLHERGRSPEAMAIIRQLPEQSQVLQEMTNVVVDLALRTGEPERALNAARKAVAEKPDDYQNRLSLGQVYWVLGQRVEAEVELRRALKLADNVPETWTTLIYFLSRTERKDEAVAAIRDAHAKLPEAKYRLAYAQCYEAVGEREQADKLYTAAVAENPKDPATLRQAAAFALRVNKQDRAEHLLKEVIKLQRQAPEDAAAARNLLALVLGASNKDHEQKRKLLAELGFLDQPPEGSAESPDDKRTRAVILAAQGRRRRDREAAIRILEDIRQAQPLSNSDQFLLAQLHESLGNKGKAEPLMQTVLRYEESNPAYLAFYVRMLLARNDADKAEPLVDRLVALQPKAWQTVQLKARLLHAQGKDAATFLTKYAADQDSPVLLAVARLLELIEEKAAAERMYDNFVDKTEQSKKPEATLVVAGFLGRTGRLSAALDRCDQVRSLCPLELVLDAALSVLCDSRAGKAEQERVARWIDEADRAVGTNAQRRSALRQRRATLSTLQDLPGEAEKTYRLCLEENPRDSLALNNLAWLLAIKGKNLDEAESLIQREIDINGPLPSRLDTRALVYLAQGKNVQAVKELEEVVADNPSGSTYFHLALAHQAANKKSLASDALREARKLGLKENDLHPFEREKYRTLVADPGLQ